jgi:hypothetical protein
MFAHFAHVCAALRQLPDRVVPLRTHKRKTPQKAKNATPLAKVATERGWQCWQPLKNANNNNMDKALTLGRLPTLSLRGQLPEPGGAGPSLLA